MEHEIFIRNNCLVCGKKGEFGLIRNVPEDIFSLDKTFLGFLNHSGIENSFIMVVFAEKVVKIIFLNIISNLFEKIVIYLEKSSPF